MSKLEEKLKSLGIHLGANHITRKPPAVSGLENILGGHFEATTDGEVFIVEKIYSTEEFSNISPPKKPSNLAGIADWIGDHALISQPLESFLFLDIETTGLSGGTGTIAFLIGIGHYQAGQFYLSQYFLRDPGEELALLLLLEKALITTAAVITFNGKTFDIPILNTRYTLYGLPSPLQNLINIDLLHLARKLWRDRLPSRSLGQLEMQILKTSRTEEDLPGWMIPQIYFDFLQLKNIEPLRNVFYHNAMDILSLAALFQHTSVLLANPLNSIIENEIDLFSLGVLFENMGKIDIATNLYMKGLNRELPPNYHLLMMQRLAKLYKRMGNFDSALELWHNCAGYGDIDAFIELAKYFEHRQQDYVQAIFWTESAIEQLNKSSSTSNGRNTLQTMEHRRNRLYNKKDQKFRKEV